jgi:hypothetical protein
MRIFFSAIFTVIFFAKISFAALPFVTDDAAVGYKNQVLLETYTENWHSPSKQGNPSAETLGQYLGFSYGLLNNFEISSGALASYDFGDHAPTLSNPFFQMKSVLYHSDVPEIPNIAVSVGYVHKSGSGLYYDNATNAYVLGIATASYFKDKLHVHFNAGAKSSYNINQAKNVHRAQLGLGIDLALYKDIRLVAESYNGAPNSPRDSPGYFNSYQAGLKWVKSDIVSFNILYGTQPTFIGYGANNQSLYRQTNWIQFGMRKIIDDVF